MKQPVKQPASASAPLTPDDFYDYPEDELDPPLYRPNFQADVAGGHLFRNRPPQHQKPVSCLPGGFQGTSRGLPGS